LRVLLINTYYDPHVFGGAERSVQVLAEALVNSGTPAVVASIAPKGGFKKQWIQGVEVCYLPFKNLYAPLNRHFLCRLLAPLWHLIDTYNPWMAQTIYRIIQWSRPEVVHTNNLSGFSVAAWGAASSLGLPVVHTLRDYYLLCPRSTMFHRKRNCPSQCWYCRLYSRLRQEMTKAVAAVVGNSRFILERHLKSGCFENAGVRDVIFNALPGNVSPGSDFGPRQKPFRLGYLGRLKPNKGLELLFQAMEMVRPEEYQLYLGGKDEMGLREKNRLGHVHFLGFVKPEEFFPKIDVLVVPSLWHDPLPRTIFEAYAHGIPVIGSSRGGIPEVIDEGKTGFIFDPDRPETLVASLQKVTSDLGNLKRMKMHAMEKSNAFMPSLMVSRYLSIYRSVLNFRV